MSALYDGTHGYYASRALVMPPKELAALLSPLIPEYLSYDTFVGMGLSGTIAVVKLAPMLNKYAAYVRKPSESNHSTRIVEGTIGQRWIFVDDMISSGRTIRRCMDAIKELVPETVCVGALLYGDSAYGQPQFQPASQLTVYAERAERIYP